MITADVRVEGFTAQDWRKLFELVAGVRNPAAKREGGVVAVVAEGRLVKLFSTAHGRLDPAPHRATVSLRTLADRHGARWAVRCEAGAFDELSERFAATLSRGQDWLAQLLAFAGVVRELVREGSLELWPYQVASAPLPSEEHIWSAVELLCRPGHVLLFGAFEGGELSTACALRRGLRGFDALVGPDELREPMGLISGDWTRDHRFLSEVVQERLGPLAVGCFGELATFRRLRAEPSPGAWSAAVAAREVILSPVSPALAVPFGVDLGLAALQFGGRVAHSFGLPALVGGSLLGSAVRELRRSPFLDFRTTLGFDPFALLASLLATSDDDEP